MKIHEHPEYSHGDRQGLAHFHWQGGTISIKEIAEARGTKPHAARLFLCKGKSVADALKPLTIKKQGGSTKGRKWQRLFVGPPTETAHRMRIKYSMEIGKAGWVIPYNPALCSLLADKIVTAGAMVQGEESKHADRCKSVSLDGLWDEPEQITVQERVGSWQAAKRLIEEEG